MKQPIVDLTGDTSGEASRSPHTAAAQWHQLSSELRRPRNGETVLCCWAPTDGSPIRGDCYSTATYWEGRWHNPEDDEDDYRPPEYWATLREPVAKARGQCTVAPGATEQINKELP